ncbi:MAG: hypothetical protein V4623_01100 [Pseudomonadota bacterium]
MYSAGGVGGNGVVAGAAARSDQLAEQAVELYVPGSRPLLIAGMPSNPAVYNLTEWRSEEALVKAKPEQAYREAFLQWSCCPPREARVLAEYYSFCIDRLEASMITKARGRADYTQHAAALATLQALREAVKQGLADSIAPLLSDDGAECPQLSHDAIKQAVAGAKHVVRLIHEGFGNGSPHIDAHAYLHTLPEFVLSPELEDGTWGAFFSNPAPANALQYGEAEFAALKKLGFDDLDATAFVSLMNEPKMNAGELLALKQQGESLPIGLDELFQIHRLRFELAGMCRQTQATYDPPAVSRERQVSICSVMKNVRALLTRLRTAPTVHTGQQRPDLRARSSTDAPAAVATPAPVQTKKNVHIEFSWAEELRNWIVSTYLADPDLRETLFTVANDPDLPNRAQNLNYRGLASVDDLNFLNKVMALKFLWGLREMMLDFQNAFPDRTASLNVQYELQQRISAPLPPAQRTKSAPLTYAQITFLIDRLVSQLELPPLLPGTQRLSHFSFVDLPISAAQPDEAR